MNVKSLLKKILPKAIVNSLKKPSLYGFFGNYTSWQDARDASAGYDSPVIFEKMKQAAMQIKNNNAAYERDTVVFDKPQYNDFVVTNLFSRFEIDNYLNVVDFGGSFGNVYFQHKNLLEKIENLSWSVVEQKHIVEFCKKEFANNIISFYEDLDIDKVLETKKPNIALFGSSLQYVREPYVLLEKILNNSVGSVIIDRTPVLEDESSDRITVQKVNPRIYDASYPAWILNEKTLKNFFEKYSYKLISETKTGSMNLDGKNQVTLKSFVFKKK